MHFWFYPTGTLLFPYLLLLFIMSLFFCLYSLSSRCRSEAAMVFLPLISSSCYCVVTTESVSLTVPDICLPSLHFFFFISHPLRFTVCLSFLFNHPPLLNLASHPIYLRKKACGCWENCWVGWGELAEWHSKPPEHPTVAPAGGRKR